MANKRECPFTPPPVTMPWMKSGDSSPSLLSRLTGCPPRSQLLQGTGPLTGQAASTQGEIQRQELANIVRWELLKYIIE